MKSLTITTRIAILNPALTIVEIAGELDINTLEELEATFEGLSKSQRYKLILDLEKLTYVSSAGIRSFLRQADEVWKKQGDIIVVGLSPATRQLFDLLRLPESFSLFETEQEAVEAFVERGLQTKSS